MEFGPRSYYFFIDLLKITFFSLIVQGQKIQSTVLYTPARKKSYTVAKTRNARKNCWQDFYEFSQR